MKYLFVNWKDALSAQESAQITKQAAAYPARKGRVLVLLPSASAFAGVAVVRGALGLGVQDVAVGVDAEPSALMSAQQAYKAGARFALVGHSSRRAAGDTDARVREKLVSALQAGFVPILFVGEDKKNDDERCAAAVRAQLGVLEGFETERLFVAYEPVWAIGSGDTASVEHVRRAFDCIRAFLPARLSQRILLLYGGSIHAQNVAHYSGLSGCSGVVVGSAATNETGLRGLWAHV